MVGRCFSLVRAGALLFPLAAAGQEASPAAPEPLIWVDAPGLSGLLARGLEDPVVARLLASDLGALVRERTGMEPAAWLAALDLWVGMPVLDTLARLSSRGATLEVWPAPGTEKGFGFGLVVQGDDAELARRVLERLLELTTLSTGESPVARALDGGGEVWELSAGSLGLRGATLASANDTEALARVLARGPRSSAGSAEGPLARARIELDALRPFEAEDGFATGLAGLAGDPGAQLVFGAQLAALGQAEALELRLEWSAEALHLAVEGVAVDWGAARALAPNSDRPLPAPLELQGGLVSALVYRDVATLFRERAELFEARTASGFAKGIADMALFFGGADISEEILPHISPWLRVVSLEPDFGAGLEPEIPLPAAGLVLELEEAERLAPRLSAAFQSLLGILNVERAQQGGEPLVLELELLGKETMTWAHFPAPAPEDGVDLRHNLAPACVRSGRHFVLASHRDLARRVVELLAREPAAPSAVVDTAQRSREELRLLGSALLQALEHNRATLVSRAQLVEGKTKERAEQDWRAVVAAVGLVDSLTVSVASSAPKRVELGLRLAFSSDQEAPEGGASR